MDNKRIIFNCLDLTSLSGGETERDIQALAQKASFEAYGHVAAICVYPQWVKTVRAHVSGSVKVATVLNFPKGDSTFYEIEPMLVQAVEDGVDELDVVIPYQFIRQGESQQTQQLLSEVKAYAPDCTLKAILETGALQSAEQVMMAAKAAIAGGADFLKTSTGKVDIGATLQAATILVEVIQNHYRQTREKIGLKLSGGLKTIAHVEPYLTLVEHVLGEGYLMPETFRIGASSLLNDIVSSSELTSSGEY